MPPTPSSHPEAPPPLSPSPPKLLAYHATPSLLHDVDAWLGRCDHYAIKVSNQQGAVHDIAYKVTISLTGDASEWEKAKQEGEDGGGHRQGTTTGLDRAEVRDTGEGSSAWTYLPWAMCAGLALLVVALLWRQSRDNSASVDERQPLMARG